MPSILYDNNEIYFKYEGLKTVCVFCVRQYFGFACHINGEAPGVLAQAAVSCGAILVHYSTDYIFDGVKNEGYTENSIPNPMNKYGQSKLIGENNILTQESRGLKYYIIRTSRLFGPQGTSVNSKQNFFDIMLEKIKEQKEINAVDDEIASFSYTPDVANATKSLILSNKNFGVYHVVNGGSASWYEAVTELEAIFGVKRSSIKPISGAFLTRPARRPKYSVLQNTKINHLRDWRDALREYVSQYRLM